MNKDYFELNDELETEKASILAEAYIAEELSEMADLLEAKATDDDFVDLISMVRETVDHNPLSETAVDLRQELLIALYKVI